jgi:hypothetical protein
MCLICTDLEAWGKQRVKCRIRIGNFVQASRKGFDNIQIDSKAIDLFSLPFIAGFKRLLKTYSCKYGKRI